MTTTAEPMSVKETIHSWMRYMYENKASDLFITAEFPPAVKLDGKLTPITDKPLTAGTCGAIAQALMTQKQREEFENTKECNFAVSIDGVARFRVNAMIQRGATALVIRIINSVIPKMDDLRLPEILKKVAMQKRGLVIFVGGTGSGKSTSLAAMIDYRNEKQLRPHHYHRRSHRIRPPAQKLHHHPARSGRGHRKLVRRPEKHPAPGARRHPHRRNPRPGNHGIRPGLRRNRPPVHGHPARQQLQPGTRPHHQLLPRRKTHPAAPPTSRSTCKPLFPNASYPKKTAKAARRR